MNSAFFLLSNRNEENLESSRNLDADGRSVRRSERRAQRWSPHCTADWRRCPTSNKRHRRSIESPRATTFVFVFDLELDVRLASVCPSVSYRKGWKSIEVVLPTSRGRASRDRWENLRRSLNPVNVRRMLKRSDARRSTCRRRERIVRKCVWTFPRWRCLWKLSFLRAATRSSYPTDIPVWSLDKSIELPFDWISFDEPVRPDWQVCNVGSWWNVRRRNPRLKSRTASLLVESLAAANSQEWVEGESSIELTIISVDVSLDLSVSQAVSVDVSMGTICFFFSSEQ